MNGQEREAGGQEPVDAHAGLVGLDRQGLHPRTRGSRRRRRAARAGSGRRTGARNRQGAGARRGRVLRPGRPRGLPRRARRATAGRRRPAAGRGLRRVAAGDGCALRARRAPCAVQGSRAPASSPRFRAARSAASRALVAAGPGAVAELPVTAGLELAGLGLPDWGLRPVGPPRLGGRVVMIPPEPVSASDGASGRIGRGDRGWSVPMGSPGCSIAGAQRQRHGGPMPAYSPTSPESAFAARAPGRSRHARRRGAKGGAPPSGQGPRSDRSQWWGRRLPGHVESRGRSLASALPSAPRHAELRMPEARPRRRGSSGGVPVPDDRQGFGIGRPRL